MFRFVKKLVFGAPYEREQAWHNLALTLARVDVRQASLGELGLDAEQSYWYANSGGPALRRVLRTLPITRADAVIDLGCGKGGAMLTLQRFPFQRVDGLDISPQLAAIARRNLKRAIICANAAQFTAFDDYTYVYMYHPFPAAVMDAVLRNLRASLAARPRPMTLIYCNPFHHDSVIQGGFDLVREYSEAVYPIRVYRPANV